MDGARCCRETRRPGSRGCGWVWTWWRRRARRESQAEGIRRLRYGFELEPLYQPLTHLALGRAYEGAGERDSAAAEYSRFLRFWDKADPELQGRVREAKEALQEITGERPGAR
jgi:hypothetical protein